MNLSAALLPLIPGERGVIAFVGAGGKTSALFRLCLELEGSGRSVLATTTTHIMDPRLEPGRPECSVLLRPGMETPFEGGSLPEPTPGLTVLLSREAEPGGKMKGIHPSWIPQLRSAWDLILVEADGSRRLPLKAPAPHEPVIPPGADLVVGVVGLECLGRPMDARTVHRPERFETITGCAQGAAIRFDALAALVLHPQGLFKDAPGRRAVLFNKADKAFYLPSPAQLRSLAADQVLLCSLQAPESVIVTLRGSR